MKFFVLLALLPLVACQFDAFYRGSSYNSDTSDDFTNELPFNNLFDNLFDNFNSFNYGNEFPSDNDNSYMNDFSFGDFIDYPIHYPTEYSFDDFIDYPIHYPTEYSFDDFIDYPIHYPTEYSSGDLDFPWDFSAGDLDFPWDFSAGDLDFPWDFSGGDLDFPWDFSAGDLDFPWDFSAGDLDFPWDFSDYSSAEDIVCEDLYDRASNFRVKKRDYTNDLARCWTIHSEGELRFNFGKFDVEASSNGCAYDRVRITDNYGFDEEYCGSDVDFGRIDTTGTTTVTFTTDGSVTAGGFFLRWKTRN